MGMVVRTNVMAVNAYRQLGMNNTQVGKSLEKLSSGFQINRAGDNASGLAISEKMKAQIRGLETASANSQDGISLIQTAEGALTEVHDMLNRMVELAGKSANGTMDDDTDRAALQKELDALKSEINRIAKGTNFNGIKLLDGSLAGAKSSYTMESAAGDLGGTASLKIEGLAGVDKVVVNTIQGAQNYAADLKNGVLTINLTDTWGTTATGSNVEVLAALKAAGLENIDKLNVTYVITGGDAGKSVTYEDLTEIKPKAGAFDAVGDIPTFGAGFDVIIEPGQTGISTFKVTSASGSESFSFGTGTLAIQLDSDKEYTASDINQILKDLNVDGVKVKFDGSVKGSDIVTGLDLDNSGAGRAFTDGTGIIGKGLTLQVGDTSEDFNKITVKVGDMSVKGLGLASVDVSIQENASDSIAKIKTAINMVSTTRADMGALQNRLEHTINNLDVAVENMTSANSRIRDTDMAKQMMEYTKMTVLTQAAQAMLAQATQQPQSILQLLQ